MKTVAIVLAALVAVAVPATALAAAAAAGPAATTVSHCGSLPRNVVDCAIWAAKCIGDALGGNACHDRAATAAAREEPADLVHCTLAAVHQIAQGVTPEPCVVETAAAEPTPAAGAPDVEDVVECAKGQVRQVLAGVTPMPCPI